MIIKKIIIFIAFVLGIYVLSSWLKCESFADPLHFSPFDMTLKLHEAINNDVNFSPNTARIFHNKVALSSILIVNSYLYFWDIKFGITLFSIVGYFGIWSGFWYLTKLKNKFKWWIFTTFLLLPLVEIFRLPAPYLFRLLFLALPFHALSVFGLWQFAKSQKRVGILVILVLIILSWVYYSVFSQDIFLNCYK